jgi:pyruvate/2-oxoglutarate dehydrogenase complex dihydrolipoamide acyltransferase (E2) component
MEEAVTETKKVEEKPAASVGASVGTDQFFEELDKALHDGSLKVAPAAGWWMRTYMILPSEVRASGPKGYIVKEDVLAHIDKNKLQKGVRVGTAASKKDAPKKPSAPKAQP